MANKRLDTAFKQIAQHNSYVWRLLVLYKPFLDDVTAIRREFNIPADGFRDGSGNPDMERASKWEQQMLWESYEKLSRQQDKLRKRKNVPVAEAQAITNSEKELPHYRWQHIIFTDLMKKYRLTDNFKTTLERYVLSGDVMTPILNFGIMAAYPSRKKREVTVSIYGHLTTHEWTALKEEVKRAQAQYPPPNSPKRLRPNIERDIEILTKTKIKGEGKFRSDREMADYIASFQDNDREAESLRGLSTKQANTIKQARWRLQRTMDEWFGDTKLKS